MEKATWNGLEVSWWMPMKVWKPLYYLRNFICYHSKNSGSHQLPLWFHFFFLLFWRISIILHGGGAVSFSPCSWDISHFADPPLIHTLGGHLPIWVASSCVRDWLCLLASKVTEAQGDSSESEVGQWRSLPGTWRRCAVCRGFLNNTNTEYRLVCFLATLLLRF